MKDPVKIVSEYSQQNWRAHLFCSKILKKYLFKKDERYKESTVQGTSTQQLCNNLLDPTCTLHSARAAIHHSAFHLATLPLYYDSAHHTITPDTTSANAAADCFAAATYPW